MRSDVKIKRAGPGASLLLFYMRTKRAKQWVEDNVSEERTEWAGALVVETRYAVDLADGMRNDGLVVE
jgi:hypothetical protein